MLASCVRPDSTSLPITSRQAVGFCRASACPSEEVAQQRDQRLVGRRHRIVGELLRPHPGQRLVLRAPSACPSSGGRDTAASADGTAHRRARRRRTAPGRRRRRRCPAPPSVRGSARPPASRRDAACRRETPTARPSSCLPAGAPAARGRRHRSARRRRPAAAACCRPAPAPARHDRRCRRVSPRSARRDARRRVPGTRPSLAGLAKADPAQHGGGGGVVGDHAGFQPVEVEIGKRPARQPAGGLGGDAVPEGSRHGPGPRRPHPVVDSAGH